MDTNLRQNPIIENKALQKELSEFKHIHTPHNDALNKELTELNNKLSYQEMENESLRRLVDRSNLDNDQLLQKLESVSKSARIFEENENFLKEELAAVKEQNRSLRNNLMESNSATDSVVQELRDVSIETKKLIDNCEKSSEENRLFRIKSEELEEELQSLFRENESLKVENKKLKYENNAQKSEILSLKKNLHVTDARMNESRNSINIMLSNINDIEQQIAALINELKKSNFERMKLKEIVDYLENNNAALLERSEEKDKYILKQNQDFQKVKITVEEYHLEITRLDTELKDCRKRVFSLNENLKSLNSENFDFVEYSNFKLILKKFENLQTIENLFCNMEVLQEIEKFFAQKLSPHVDDSNCDQPERNDDTTVSDKTENVIIKIQVYLEKALFAIEKLNNKIQFLKTDYENKLQLKNDEISTLREVLSNATLYNKILEQTLQQCKDNTQLDKTIESKIDELVTVNKTLLDSFDEIRKLYHISERKINFFNVKSKQLSLFVKILKITLQKSFKTYDENFSLIQDTENCSNSKNISLIDQKLRGLFFLMEEIFEEINDSENDIQQSAECRKLLDDCQENLITKDYLKSSVENMSLEVKRLTCKVEQEMSEKIREIELLRGEMDSMKVDNRELVNKIKSCNREIISLSTDNYDLNEKLVNLLENGNKLIKFANSANVKTDPDRKLLLGKIENVNRLCVGLKSENENLRKSASTLFHEVSDDLLNVCNIFESNKEMQKDYSSDLATLKQSCHDANIENKNLKEFVVTFKEEINKILLSSLEICNKESSFVRESGTALKEKLNDLKTICRDMKIENEELKNLNSSKLFENTFSSIKSILLEKLQFVYTDFDKLENNLNFALKDKNDIENNLIPYLNRIAVILQEIKVLKNSLRVFIKELPSEFSKFFGPMKHEIQIVLAKALENVKESALLSNEEIIKEMQDMNLELKKRGEIISNLNQFITELEKGKKQMLENLNENENTISEITNKVANCDKEIINKEMDIKKLQEYIAKIEAKYAGELELITKSFEDLKLELKNAKTQIGLKEDIIFSLENEISKQKEIHDGDVSSMGNISRTEEISRLKDVEDSFEERYMKLRILAVKMKKNISELNQQLVNEKQERSVLQNKMSSVSEQAKRSQALQEECDKLTDDLELKLNEIKELKKIIAESDKVNKNLKQKSLELSESLNSFTKDSSSLQSEKIEAEKQVKELTISLEQVNKEKSVEIMVKKEQEKEIQQLKQKLREVEQVSKKIQNDLEQAKLEARKQGALTLEMRDYEKTISDLTTQVKEQQGKIVELNEELKHYNETKISLLDQINQLEEKLSSSVTSNTIADDQILHLNKLISKNEHELNDQKQRLKNTVLQLETVKSENETLTLQLIDSSAKIESSKETYEQNLYILEQQTKSSQEKVTCLEEKLKKQENEYEKLKDDFEAYKIRAHTVIQKLKTNNSPKNDDENLKQEISILSQTVKELRKQLDGALFEVENEKTKYKFIETKNENLLIKVKELSESLNEKTKELDATLIEYKLYELTSGTHVDCYKTEIEKLNSYIEKLKVKRTRNIEKNTTNSTGVNFENEENSDVSNSDFGSYDKLLENKVDEWETTEDKNFDEKNSTHSVIPLDKLLENDIDEDSITITGNKNELRQQIRSLEKQVKYLSKILNESEKNAARNEQQVTILKEEIRRLQRTFEREPHMQNNEYVKNVLLKFVSLPNGDEKCRLVNVLDTILKLAPDERKMISAVAQGCHVDQKSNSGWTSFLGWS